MQYPPALVTQEPGDKLLNLSSLLHSACQDSALQEWEWDLLQDSVLFLWDTVRPAVSQLHSHHFNTTRPLTSSRRGKEVTSNSSMFALTPKMPISSFPPILL